MTSDMHRREFLAALLALPAAAALPGMAEALPVAPKVAPIPERWMMPLMYQLQDGTVTRCWVKTSDGETVEIDPSAIDYF